MSGDLVPLEKIQQAVLLLRGRKVMLDRDLAALYGARQGLVKPHVAMSRRVVNRIIEAAQSARLFPVVLKRYLKIQVFSDPCVLSRRRWFSLAAAGGSRYLLLIV